MVFGARVLGFEFSVLYLFGDFGESGTCNSGDRRVYDFSYEEGCTMFACKFVMIFMLVESCSQLVGSSCRL